MERREKFQHYLSEIAQAVNRYQQEHNAFVAILGMEQLDEGACKRFEQLMEGPHQVYHSKNHDVFQMTGLLRQFSMLVTSRYHAAVLSMKRAIPLVAISMDGRLDGVIQETELADHYLHHVDDADLGEHLTTSLHLADLSREKISNTIRGYQAHNEHRVNEMSQYFASWLHSPLLPDNLYVADATILPQALGLPPVLTIMALAKRIAAIISRHNE